jgi:hypothetical protein
MEHFLRGNDFEGMFPGGMNSAFDDPNGCGCAT